MKPSSPKEESMTVDLLKNKLREQVTKDPKKAATILTDWMRGQSKSKKAS